MTAMNFTFDLPWAALAAVALTLLSCVTFWFWHRRRVARLSRLGAEVAIARLAPAGVRRAQLRSGATA